MAGRRGELIEGGPCPNEEERGWSNPYSGEREGGRGEGRANGNKVKRKENCE